MSRTLYSILGNGQRLDGGAMFGNAPRALWSRWLTPDDEHRIALACRALLVVEPNRSILFETGVGAFFHPDLRARYGVESPEHVLLEGLAEAGVPHDRVDLVVLSHLHFDHAGGLLAAWQEGQAPSLLFPRARFVVSRPAWDRAVTPHARDRASYIPELPALLADSGRLDHVEVERCSEGSVAPAPGEAERVLGPGYRFHMSEGHTPGMLLTEIPGEHGPILFAADLVPGVAWLRGSITMGYDRFAELLIEEKMALLKDLASRGGRVFYTHDPEIAISGLQRDDRGHYLAQQPVASLRGDAA